MSINGGIDKDDVLDIHNGILLNHEKWKLFAATQLDLEMIILSGVSKRKTNVIWYHLYVESNWKKTTQMNFYLKNRNRLTSEHTLLYIR